MQSRVNVQLSHGSVYTLQVGVLKGALPHTIQLSFLPAVESATPKRMSEWLNPTTSKSESSLYCLEEMLDVEEEQETKASDGVSPETTQVPHIVLHGSSGPTYVLPFANWNKETLAPRIYKVTLSSHLTSGEELSISFYLERTGNWRAEMSNRTSTTAPSMTDDSRDLGNMEQEQAKESEAIWKTSSARLTPEQAIWTSPMTISGAGYGTEKASKPTSVYEALVDEMELGEPTLSWFAGLPEPASPDWQDGWLATTDTTTPWASGGMDMTDNAW